MPAVTPPQLYQNYALLASGASAPSEGIFIPLASLDDLSAAEANATTGDGRKVALALTRELQSRYNLLATNARPAKLSISANTPTGVSGTVVRQNYTVGFDLDTASADMTAE